MASLNQVILIGRLTRDMEVKYINTGTACGDFSLAVNKKYKDKEEVSFFDCTCWGKTAEALGQYMTKGKLIAVEGELKQDRWEQEGHARSKVKINVNNIQLLSFDDTQASASVPQQHEPAGFDEIPF